MSTGIVVANLKALMSSNLTYITNSLSEPDWHKAILLTTGPSLLPLSRRLPKMPPKEFQENYTGASGAQTLNQAFNAYSVFKAIALKNGIQFDKYVKVLDFGVGWGRIIRFFLRDVQDSNLYGVDVSPEAIKVCKSLRLNCNLNISNSLPPLEFSDNSFDVIYLYSVFSHLSEEAHTSWIKEFHRILKPGGVVIATTRPRDFVERCAQLREKENLQGFQKGAANSFMDTYSALEAYDRGEFIYAGTGGGGVLDSSFYGEACVPEAWVQQNWGSLFSKVDFVPVSEHGRFDQHIIWGQK